VDGREPEGQDADVQNSLKNLIITWPIKEWQWGQPENQSPYGSSALQNGTKDLLFTLESFRKWSLYDALEEVLAHQQSMSLYTAVGVRGSSENGENSEVEDYIEVNQGVSTQEIEHAKIVCDSIFNSWNGKEIQIWSLRSQVRSRDSHIIVDGEEISRQTFSNRLTKLAKSTFDDVSLFIDNQPSFQTLDESDFTALVWEMLDEKVSGEYAK
jgi:hypothetical protein